jgi:hypothetical protein
MRVIIDVECLDVMGSNYAMLVQALFERAVNMGLINHFAE